MSVALSHLACTAALGNLYKTLPLLSRESPLPSFIPSWFLPHSQLSACLCCFVFCVSLCSATSYPFLPDSFQTSALWTPWLMPGGTARCPGPQSYSGVAASSHLRVSSLREDSCLCALSVRRCSGVECTRRQLQKPSPDEVRGSSRILMGGGGVGGSQGSIWFSEVET